MNKKLYRAALITSPIIAVYGGSAFYIFNAIDLKTYLVLTIGLTVNVFLIWIMHIVYAQKFPNSNPYLQFFVTYLSNLIFRLLIHIINLVLHLPKPQFVDNYLSYPILTSFVLNIIIMVIVNSIVTTFKKAETEKQLQDIQLQNIEAQKQLLIQQLQPHFLFNALSTLKSLIGFNSQLAENYIIKLSDFLRYSIQSNQVELVSLEEELQFTQDYIDLQKMRYDAAFEYSINIPKECLHTQIPVLALQTLIENIFKHNYFTEKNKLVFAIQCTTNKIEVTNTKTSLKTTEKTQTGLINLNKRYELICGKSIFIEDNEKSFTVTLPLIKK